MGVGAALPPPPDAGPGAGGPAYTPVAAGKRERSGCGGRGRRLGFCGERGHGGGEARSAAPRGRPRVVGVQAVAVLDP